MPNGDISEDVYTIIISNEAPGRLIDRLVARGYGDLTLIEALAYFRDHSRGVISEDFYNQVYNAPAGSEVFTAKLENYVGIQGGVEISADGTIHTRAVTAAAYDGTTGYLTLFGDSGQFKFTHAQDVANYIYTGNTQLQVGPIVYNYDYYAFAIVWGEGISTYLPLVTR